MSVYKGKNNYLGAWAYVLLSILYLIPVIGWIICILHCFKPDSQNLCHYARSCAVRALLVVGIVAIFAGVMFLVQGKDAFLADVNKLQNWFDSCMKLWPKL